MSPPLLYPALAYIVIINLVALGVMLRDKQLSIRNNNSDRVPEGILFFLAALFGGVGIYVGMFLFRHKTRRWYFVIGIPLLIAQNLLTLYYVETLWGNFAL